MQHLTLLFLEQQISQENINTSTFITLNTKNTKQFQMIIYPIYCVLYVFTE